MGNTSSIYRKNGLITRKEISDTLNEINKEVFDNKLPIHINESGVMFINEDADLYWWFEDKPFIHYSYDEETDTETETEISDNNIEYRDVPRLDASSWLQDVLTKEFSKRLGLINYCPAIDSVMDDPYPKSFEEYMLLRSPFTSLNKIKNFLMTPMQRNLYKENLKLTKHFYPKDVYEYFFENKFKIK